MGLAPETAKPTVSIRQERKLDLQNVESFALVWGLYVGRPFTGLKI